MSYESRDLRRDLASQVAESRAQQASEAIARRLAKAVLEISDGFLQGSSPDMAID